MAHAQKPDFVFRLNGRVHLNRQGRQFSRLLAAEVRISGSNAGHTKFLGSEGYCLPTPFASLPFNSPLVRHRVPSRFNWTLQALTGDYQYCCVIGRARIFLSTTKHSSRKACHFATCFRFSTSTLLHRPPLIADDQMFSLNCSSAVTHHEGTHGSYRILR